MADVGRPPVDSGSAVELGLRPSVFFPARSRRLRCLLPGFSASAFEYPNLFCFIIVYSKYLDHSTYSLCTYLLVEKY